ncbi:uncharacterized protein LOC115212414 [Argonauta hians]
MENSPVSYLSKPSELDWRSRLQSRRSRRKTRGINEIFLKDKATQPNAGEFSPDSSLNQSSSILLRRNYSYDSGVVSDMSRSPTPTFDEDLCDNVNRLTKKRSQSVPALLRIDIYQYRAMKLMRKRHGKIFGKRKVTYDESSDSAETSPNSKKDCSPSDSQDFVFTFDYSEINDLNKELLSMDSNTEEPPNVETHPESSESGLLFKDYENNNVFHITPSMMKSFAIQKEIRRKRRSNRAIHSFDDNCLRRESS